MFLSFGEWEGAVTRQHLGADTELLPLADTLEADTGLLPFVTFGEDGTKTRLHESLSLKARFAHSHSAFNQDFLAHILAIHKGRP